MKKIKYHIGLHHIATLKSFILVLAIILGGVLGMIYSIKTYPEIFQTEARMEKTKEIRPKEGVVISFSTPILISDYEKNLKITPSENATFEFRNSNTQLVIFPEKFWKPETNYSIEIPESRNVMLAKVEAKKFNFSTVSFPKVKESYPADGAKDVLMDIEDPVVFDFNKSTQDFFLKFIVSPESKMTYQNNPEKTQFKLLPGDKIKEGENYQIKIMAKYKEDNDTGYKEIFKTSFTTVPPEPLVWEKDLSLRVSQARKVTKPKITSGKYIDINLAVQILSTFEDGKLLDSYLISTGKRGMDTPRGEFKILSKRQRPWSKKYGLYMPWFMLFTNQGHGIHELPEWPGGYKEGQNHLGIPVSHGCVRLGVGPAKIVYDWAEIGTTVVVY